MKKHVLLLAALMVTVTYISGGQPAKKPVTPPATAKTASRGSVYLRTVMFNGLSITWVYLGNDGVIVWDPKHGVDPVNVAAEKADNSANTGTYKLAGNKLLVNWQNGKSAEMSVEYNGKAISAIDGGLTTKHYPYLRISASVESMRHGHRRPTFRRAAHWYLPRTAHLPKGVLEV